MVSEKCANVQLVNQIFSYMILEQSPSEGPDTCENKVDLVKLSRGIGRGVVLSQEAFQ